MVPVILALALFAQDKPAVDRSAEADLKQLFVNASHVRNVHIVIDSFSKAAGDWYTASGTSDLYLGPGSQFRYERNSSSILICDGTSLMDDPLSDDETIVLKRAPAGLYELTSQDVLSFFLAGDVGFDKLVEKTSSVVAVKEPGNQKAIEFKSFSLGKIVVAYDDGHALPERIDMYRSFRRRDDGAEQATPSTMQYVRVVSAGALPRSLFSVQPPKGQKVDDRRTVVGKG